MNLRVSLWFEHRDLPAKSLEIYPDGMQGAIAGCLEAPGDIACRRFTMDGPPMAAADLDATDVLIWYGHLHHRAVDDRLVDLVWKRVLEGMGFITFHSGHFSKPFVRLMGTTGQLSYRAQPHEREVVWNVCPGHPIAQGIGEGFVFPQEEVYREFHDIAAPEELVFLSSFEGGEAFRSGCCWRRGAGRVFYFRWGHETCPTFHQPEVRRVLVNAVRWAAPVDRMAFEAGPRKPLDLRRDPTAEPTLVIGGSHPLKGVLDPKKYR
jgi:trehalose utilization protein